MALTGRELNLEEGEVINNDCDLIYVKWSHYQHLEIICFLQNQQLNKHTLQFV